LFVVARYDKLAPMRRFTLVQELSVDAATHWRVFLDDAVDRDLYLECLGFLGYEILERRSNEREEVRRIRVIPRFELPAPLRKMFGSSFAYTEDGHYDVEHKVWRSSITPSMFADRMSQTNVVRVTDAGGGRCRRTIDCTAEARVFGFGGKLEAVLENNLREGWECNARFLEERAKS
jgi:hypothetical protein